MCGITPLDQLVPHPVSSELLRRHVHAFVQEWWLQFPGYNGGSGVVFDMGTPNSAGAVVTASGLIFIAATTDDLLWAMNIETGEVLGGTVLPAGGQAGPAIYEVNGRQNLVMNAGGTHSWKPPIGDYFLAYALPE